MKSCPTCNRTYADDTLTFCLVDGAILSAPYDPQATLQMAASRQTEQPPTQVLPAYAAQGQPARPRRSSLLPLLAIAGVVLLAGAVGLFFVLRQSTPPASSVASSPDASSSPTQPAASSSPTPLSSPRATSVALSSPTAAYNTAYNAVKNKDAAAFKRVMTKQDQQNMEDSAKLYGKSSEEMLKDLMDAIPLPGSNQSRDEKIDGDTATLEVINEDGEWETVEFIKEDGEWKMK
jgi:flagellar basal body-associated protein FliL